MGLRRTKPALSLPKGWMKMTPQVFIPIRVHSLACGAAKPTVFPLSVAIFAGVPHERGAHQEG
jgi:hypothetical protein